MLNSVQQQIVDGVEQNGWYSVSYRPGPDDPEEWFTYTVGLTKTAGWPEIICFGLERELAFGILRDAIGECWERGIKPADGVQLDRALRSRPTRLKRVDGLPHRYFAMADWYADHSGTPALPERLQLIWSDSQGRFPDNPDCPDYVRELQIPKVQASAP